MCDCCDKAFPLRSALDLHKSSAHPDSPAPAAATEGGNAEKTDEKAEAATGENGVVGDDSQADEQEVPPSEQESFLELLGLQHVSKVKSGRGNT